MMSNEEKFEETLDLIEDACSQLKWNFHRATIPSETGRFEIDGITYLLCAEELGAFDDLSQNRYYASVIVEYPGTYHEPPDSDEKVLPGDNTYTPSGLISRILDAHWSTRKDWVMENLSAPSEEDLNEYNPQ